MLAGVNNCCSAQLCTNAIEACFALTGPEFRNLEQ